MSGLERTLARVPADRFWPLPRAARADGTPRRAGIEIEFAGLTEGGAATVVQDLWGGDVAARDEHEVRLEGTRMGEVTVKLDTALTAQGGHALADALLDLSRVVVPVEVVTGPLPPDALPEVDRLLRALESVGAQSSRDGVFYGFGVHLNPEIAAPEPGHVVGTARAFALMEDWLRAADPPDFSRRVLPFVAPWPRAFTDRIAAEGGGWSLAALCSAYLSLVASRNHGLDLLPMLEHLFPETVRGALPAGQAKGGRPTWHFRLPETRVTVPGWSLAYEWNRWVLVERVGDRPALVEHLAREWAVHRRRLTATRSDWAQTVNRLLQEAEIWDG
ncbi:amidoligase family protein [Roseovarius salinarum]|uniref:amidoligase family protein n=1 Tax=Roseovarius salinarum TaxID=1981892 RepID=UPI000C339B9B|nr:amidoligase family protein [Roseovarius salinarum]